MGKNFFWLHEKPGGVSFILRRRRCRRCSLHRRRCRRRRHCRGVA